MVCRVQEWLLSLAGLLIYLPLMNFIGEVCALNNSYTLGGTLIFSSCVSLDPSSIVHPKKYQEYQAPQKLFEILATPKHIPIRYLDLRKDPKMHRNGP